MWMNEYEIIITDGPALGSFDSEKFKSKWTGNAVSKGNAPMPYQPLVKQPSVTKPGLSKVPSNPSLENHPADIPAP